LSQVAVRIKSIYDYREKSIVARNVDLKEATWILFSINRRHKISLWIDLTLKMPGLIVELIHVDRPGWSLKGGDVVKLKDICRRLEEKARNIALKYRESLRIKAYYSTISGERILVKRIDRE